MAANQKVERSIDAIVNLLTFRGYTVTKAYEAVTNDAYITVVGSTTGGVLAQKALVRIKPVLGLYGQANSPAETDGLGLAQRVYNPLVAQVLFNIDVATNATTTARNAIVKGHEALILGEVLKAGMVTELHTFDSAAGTMAVANFGTVTATFQPDMFQPYSGQ